MNKKIFSLIVVCLFCEIAIYAQNRVKIMSYNLLNFNNYTSYCTSQNNPHEAKAGYLATIVANQQPDILACCEVGKTQSLEYTMSYILGNSLNVNGVTRWEKAAASGNIYLNNALFYDKTKFKLTGQAKVDTDVREINIYKLKHLGSGDTLKVVVVHLKAGSGYDAERGAMIQEFMNWMQTQGNNDNYLICGDFNVYTSAESAIQKLVNPSYMPIAFYDPINQLGDWTSNSFYRNYHTQSTHSSSDNDCFAYGGMDDRFDLILMSGSLIDGSKNISYVPDSYWAVGQDGNRYNQSISYPENESLPEDVISALYNMSDHLPIVAEFDFGSASVSSPSSDEGFFAVVPSPIKDDLKFKLKSERPINMTVSLYSVLGNLMKTYNVFVDRESLFDYDVSDLQNGMYVLRFEGDGIVKTHKIIKSE